MDILTYIHFHVCALYACMFCTNKLYVCMYEAREGKRIVVLRMVSYFNVTALVESIQLIQ